MAREFVLCVINPCWLVGTCFMCGLCGLHLLIKSDRFNVTWITIYPLSIISIISYILAIWDFPQFSKHAMLFHTLCLCPLSSHSYKSLLLFSVLPILFSSGFPSTVQPLPAFPPTLNLSTWWRAVVAGIPTSHLSVSIYPPYCCQVIFLKCKSYHISLLLKILASAASLKQNPNSMPYKLLP